MPLPLPTKDCAQVFNNVISVREDGQAVGKLQCIAWDYKAVKELIHNSDHSATTK